MCWYIPYLDSHIGAIGRIWSLFETMDTFEFRNGSIRNESVARLHQMAVEYREKTGDRAYLVMEWSYYGHGRVGADINYVEPQTPGTMRREVPAACYPGNMAGGAVADAVALASILGLELFSGPESCQKHLTFSPTLSMQETRVCGKVVS